MSITAEAYRNLGTSEHRLQVLVLQHVAQRGKPGVRAIAITNEGRRSAMTAARMKERGLTPGAPDLVVVLPNREVAWLELKRGKNGRMSVAQKGMQAWLTSMGHDYCVAHSLDEAITFLEQVGALR